MQIERRTKTPIEKNQSATPRFLARWGNVIVVLVFIALALGYSVVIPLGEAADEVSHLAYVEHLITNQNMPQPEGAVLGESHQPPLYYALAALATAWIPRDEFVVLANPDFVLNDPQTPNLLLHPRREGLPYSGTALAWHLVRGLSILFAVVTVWAVWRTTREFFPNDVVLPLAAAAFVAFLPSFLSLSAVVNNDNLIIMLASLIFLLVAQMTMRGLARKRTVLLGVLLGLALWTKLSGLVVWCFVGSSYLLLGLQTRAWRASVRSLALCFVIALALSAPYLIYNWRTHGDPLGWNLYLQVGTLRETPWALADLPKLTGDLFTSFWGRFGGALQLRMSNVLYLVLGLGALCSIVGWIRAARSGSIDATARRILLLSVLFALLIGAAYVRWAIYDLGAGQARQLFPALLPLGLVLTMGWAFLFSSQRAAALLSWGGAFCVFGIAALVLLNTIYAPPLLANNSEAAAESADAIDFGNTLRVVSYHVEQNQIAPGKEIHVRFVWQALTEPTENYWLSLQLVGSDGGVANKDGVPSAGRRTTDWWQTGQRFTSKHVLLVPEDVAPGTYALMLGIHPYDRWEWLPVQRGTMIQLSTIAVAVAVP